MLISDQKKLFRDEYPLCFNGIETANPSGKFCKPIPMAREIATPKVASGEPNDAAPNATPIAKPSGILCMVITRTRRLLFLFLFLDLLHLLVVNLDVCEV
jgi:hypothetical protein